MRKTRRSEVVLDVLVVVMFAGAVLARSLFAAGAAFLVLGLASLWQTLRRDSEELRAHLANAGGGVSWFVNRAISKLPAVAAKGIYSLLGLIFVGLGLATMLGLGPIANSAIPAPRTRAGLVARANSICAAADAKFAAIRVSSTASVDELQGYTAALVQITNQETRDVRRLVPTADVARDWRTVVAGLVAHDDFMDAAARFGDAARATGPSRGSLNDLRAEGAKLDRAAHLGNLAEHRLGVHCSTFQA